MLKAVYLPPTVWISVFSELINRKYVRNVCFVINRLYMEIYVKMRVEKKKYILYGIRTYFRFSFLHKK